MVGMSAGKAIAAVIGIGIVFVIYIGVAGYVHFTVHEQTVNVKNKWIDYSKQGSHYLVADWNGHVIELERPWFDWSNNIDTLYNDVSVNSTRTYECFGWDIQGWYWYPNCYREIKT